MNGRVNILGHNPADRFLLYEKPKDYFAFDANDVKSTICTTIC